MIKEFLNMLKGNDLLNQAYNRSYEMLDITREMYQTAKISLREKDDNTIDFDIYKLDIAVNKYEREVRRNVFNHLVVGGKDDIYSGLVLINIIIDIERIGDYTKNIIELAQNHPTKLNGGIYDEDLIKIENAVLDTFNRVRDVIKNGDKEKAKEIIEEYEWVNTLCNKHVTDYLNERDKTLHPTSLIALTLYYRFLKRINSHLRNIISSVTNPFDKIGFFKKKKNEDE